MKVLRLCATSHLLVIGELLRRCVIWRSQVLHLDSGSGTSIYRNIGPVVEVQRASLDNKARLLAVYSYLKALGLLGHIGPQRRCDKTFRQRPRMRLKHLPKA